ncbi:hypothetical protein BJ741DRAFT_625564 [Chytriomyces cf. hyalinus JEL632]|nr:hypothetical protein BJ741DRAFT_625564 [Chytriomyces cf. hyalinus JEL632]
MKLEWLLMIPICSLFGFTICLIEMVASETSAAVGVMLVMCGTIRRGWSGQKIGYWCLIGYWYHSSGHILGGGVGCGKI